MMRAAFFLASPEVDLADAQNNSYLDQLTFLVITAHEVERAIKRMALRKALGRDDIPAHILR
jgi:predicted ABC-type ATPase